MRYLHWFSSSPAPGERDASGPQPATARAFLDEILRRAAAPPSTVASGPYSPQAQMRRHWGGLAGVGRKP